jgi:hypothetical protein
VNDPNQPPGDGQNNEPELELDLPPPPRSSTPSPRPSMSNPRLAQVRSAAREQPLAAAPQRATGDRLKESASDTVLNAFSILSEVIDDFKSSDRFFKYKALVLTTWLLLSVGAFGVACPGSGSTNDLNASLVPAGDGVYMVKNESSDVWQDVEIIVNGKYRATQSRVEASGGNVTLSPGILWDEAGKRAPSSLTISDITVKARDPEAEVPLLRGGAPVQ